MLKSSDVKAASITESGSYAFYQSNGDFGSDGGDGKQYLFYKYMSDFDSFTWDNLNYMTVNAVSDGVRLKYRITGFRSGGGGTMVFDSGWSQYAVATEVKGANFDYYLLELRAYDTDGVQIPLRTIDSVVTYFGYGVSVQLPTTPPELVDSAQNIESAIVGGEVETLPPDSDGLPTYTSGALGRASFGSDIIAFFGAFWYLVNWCFSVHPAYTSAFTLMILIAVVGYILYGRGS